MSKRKQITTTLNADLLKRLKIEAVKKDTNVANILDKLIEDYLNNKSEVY